MHLDTINLERPRNFSRIVGKIKLALISMTTESYLQRLSHTKQLTAVVGLGLQVTGYKRAQEEVPTKSSSFWHKQRTEH